MITPFPFGMPGTEQDFNNIIDSMPGEFETTNPFLPFPDQIIVLDAGEDYTVSGIQPSSILNADSAGGHNIVFNSSGLGALGTTGRIAFLVIGTDYSITAGGITFEMTSGPCIVVGHQQGWRALTIGSQIVTQTLADGIFDLPPQSLITNSQTATDWVQDEIRRYIRILNMGEQSDYQKMLDNIPNGSFVPSVTFPAPPLGAGTTTLTIEAWKLGVHRVREIPIAIQATAHTININLAQYTQDLIESGQSSTAYIHFEQSEANVTIPFQFVNMPSNMSWGLDPADVFTTVSAMNVQNFHALRLERIDNTLFVLPYSISPT